MATALRLQILLEAVDRATAPIRRASAAVAGVAAAAGRLRAFQGAGLLARALGLVAGRALDATRALRQVAGRAALLGTGAALGGLALFRSQFLNTAAQFERFSTILEVLEGDADRARQAMSWVQDFATRTPYELNQVVDAFVRLRGAGVDATQFLESVGNAAAARGKSLEQAAEAFNDAIMGETERLKEFGITASREGERITFEYAVRGQQFQRTVDATNREIIASTLGAIWNTQYPGAMQQLSRTWDGMLSNLSDAWQRFTLAVMNAGVFDWLKERLAALLATIERLSADGTLARWAQMLADRFTKLFAATERFLLGVDGAPGAIERLWQVMQTLGGWVSWIGETFGWTETMIGVLLATIGAPLLVALAVLGKALAVLGLVMAATPIGWLIGGLTALGLAATWLVRNWDGAAAALGDTLGGIADLFGGLFDFLRRNIDPQGRLAEALMTAWAPVQPYFQSALDALLTVFRTGFSFIRGEIDPVTALPDLIMRAWSPLTEFFRGLFDGITGTISAAAETIGSVARGIGEAVDWIFGSSRPAEPPEGAPERAARFGRRGALGGFPMPPGLAEAEAEAASPEALARGREVRVDTGGTLRVEVEDRRTRVTGRPNDPRQRYAVDQGLLMGVP